MMGVVSRTGSPYGDVVFVHYQLRRSEDQEGGPCEVVFAQDGFGVELWNEYQREASPANRRYHSSVAGKSLAATRAQFT
jgi:hypothetical protein